MSNNIELEEAIKVLSEIVKKSEALDGANHLDFTLVSASRRPLYKAALEKANFYIGQGVITQEEFKQKLGIG